METKVLCTLLVVTGVVLLTPTSAVPAEYMEGGMGESVHGDVRRVSKKLKENIINPPQALTQEAPGPEVAYKEVMSPEVMETSPYVMETSPDVMETPPEVAAEEQTTYEAVDLKEGLTRNQLNDYPPEQEAEVAAQAGYKHNELPATFPAGRVSPSAGYPFLYRGYPYIYGYPFDSRYGYAYGHAFGSDETFKCPSDGRYYRDFGSFYNCKDSEFTVQFCAPGSRNAPPARHLNPDRASFCNINMVGGNIPLLLPH